MIRKLWTLTSSIGIQPTDDEKTIRRLTLINQYIFIAFLLYLINGISDVLLGFTHEGFLLLLSALVFLASLYLNKHRHHRLSITALFIFITVTLFYFGALKGIQSGDYLYYFPLVLSVSFAYDNRKDRYLMLTLYLIILCFMAMNVYTYHELPGHDPVTESARRKMFTLNLILSSSTLGFFIYLTIKNNDVINDLYRQRLSEKEKNEALIKKSLMEKELLMAELHHRVKNNMAIMSGFFNLKMNTTISEEAKIVLLESRNRINSMALIHNHLYHKEDVSEISFEVYINDLVNEIKNSYPSIAGSVTVTCDIAGIRLDLNTAMPVALILNELLTNCYKHAFGAGQKGGIRIEFKPYGDGKFRLGVKDNGVGFESKPEKQNSLGLTVIEALSQQLNGTHQYTHQDGTTFELIF